MLEFDELEVRHFSFSKKKKKKIQQGYISSGNEKCLIENHGYSHVNIFCISQEPEAIPLSVYFMELQPARATPGIRV